MIQSEIQRRKSAISILDVITRSGVDLQSAGKDHIGLCPFHKEKTPSFTVSGHKQIFYCFGCGCGGDVIEYVMRRYGLSFPDALKYLGIEDEEKPVVSKRREARAIRRAKHAKRRKQQAEELKRNFDLWLAWYGPLIVDLLEVTDRICHSMTWDRLLGFSEIIKERSVWNYHRWLIFDVADEGMLYELYYQESVKK